MDIYLPEGSIEHADQPEKRSFWSLTTTRSTARPSRTICPGTSVQVLTAHTAKDGLALCEREPVDVVLLDQQLPDAEGYTICPAILKYNERIKIIFATAYPSFDNAIKALKGGAYDYLTKPFELDDLGSDRGARLPHGRTGRHRAGADLPEGKGDRGGRPRGRGRAGRDRCASSNLPPLRSRRS